MSKPAQENTITLDAIDKEGRKRKVRLHAVPIGPDENKIAAIRKQEQDPDIAGSSNAEQLDPFSRASLGVNHLIEPPYPLFWLCAQKENNTELGQCINAMATNTVGFGWTLRERPMPDALKTKLRDLIEIERDMLRARLTAIHPTESLDMILEKVKIDQHSCGNGYIELIDDNLGELVGLNHVVGHAVRLTEKPNKAIKVAVPIIQTDKEFQLGETSMWYRFRKYAMMLSGRKILWFKEAGDPRFMDKWTGEFSNDVPAPRRATSLLHFRNYNSLSAYGVPHWIGNLFSIRGSRRAEEINYNTLTNNNIPSMFVIVENGALTEASIERLKTWTEQQVSKGLNYSKFLLLEGETVDDGSPNPQNFRIKTIPLASLQKDDQLFQAYDQNNREKIRQSFRLPPIFVGRCHSEDTEYLTEHGWLTFDQIGEDYKLGTMNKETGMLEFQLPTERFSYDWDGPCLRIKSRSMDSLTTPHHRFWTRLVPASKEIDAQWTMLEGRYLSEYAVNNNCGFLELPVSAGWSGFTFDNMLPIPSSLLPQERNDLTIAKLSRMIVCFIGSYVSGNNAEDRVKLEEEITKLAGCSLGIEAWVRQTCGIKAEEKRLPRWVFDLNEDLLKSLLNSILQEHVDFTEPKPDVVFQYATLSKQLNDDLHELCIRLGISMVSRCMDTSVADGTSIWRSYGQKTKVQLIHPSTHIRAEHYTGKVSCFSVPNDTLVTRRNGRVLISGNTTDYTKACYSEDTETLVETGWKRFDEISEGEKIAVLDPVTNVLDYKEPNEALYVYPYSGEMFLFANRNVDIKVTPDHDMWLSNIKGSQYSKIHAEDIEFSRFFFRTAPDGFINIDAPEYFVLPEINLYDGPNAGIRKEIKIPIKLWVRFISAFVADGSTTPEFVRGTLRHMYNVVFGVYKERKINILRPIFDELKALGLNVYKEGCADDGRHTFCLADKGLWKVLRDLCGTSTFTKRLPQEFVHYPVDLLRAITDVLQQTDGTTDHRPGRTNWNYSTSSRELADQVQQICLHLGHRSNIYEAPERGNRKVNYRVLITPDKRECLVRQEDIKTEYYDGFVYCFNVPNHLFFTRRNGKVAVHGNTAETSRSVADEQVFAPDRNKDIFMLNRFVILRWGARFHTLKLNNPNVTDDASLINLMGIAERSGGMTPRRADRIVRDVFGDDIGPMPDGVPLDVPFTVTFAQAQSGMISPTPNFSPNKPTVPTDEEPGAVAQRMVGGLLDLRQRIEDELNGRFADDSKTKD